MLLSELLKEFIQLQPAQDCQIKGLSSDSRQIKAGDLFIAYLGHPDNTNDYIEHAISQGAVAVLYAADNQQIISSQLSKAVPILPIPQLSDRAGEIAARFYRHPSKSMQMIGITGTNGKTSCSQFIAQALTLAGQSCGIIGTLGNGFPDRLMPGVFTTPDALGLQKLLADFVQQGAKAISMEVSSHGLEQNRVGGTKFDIAVFTNLTRDHLDYHGSMENYAKAKRRLFTLPGLKYAIINADDDYGRQWIKEFAGQLSVYAYSTNPKTSFQVPMVQAYDLQYYDQGISAKLQTPWGESELHSHLLGHFNLSNLLAVFTVLRLMNIPQEQALQYLTQMSTVAGRMQRFGGGKQPLVVVDYSHTPDSLEKALLALREHCTGKLWCVFGCGGDRDPGKRPLMGRIAEKYSDHAIITNDNPRHEDPKRITDEVLKGLEKPQNAHLLHDRKAAIEHAIGCAKPGDVVLIAGKGHEAYQQIGDDKLPFSDIEQVKYFLESMKK